MSRHDPILPLIICLLLALGVHAGAVAGYVVWQNEPLVPPPAAEPTPPKPDLTVTNLDAAEPRIAGRPGAIQVALANAASGGAAARVAAPFDVELFIDDRYVARFTHAEPVDPGAAFTHTFIYAPAEPGVYRVRAVVDSAEAIDESDESNNALAAVLVWSAPESAADGGEPGKPDLAIATLDVPEPRVVKEPTRVIGHVANLGEAITDPIHVAALVDGKLVGVAELRGGLPAGAVVGVAVPFAIDAPGKHQITLIADPERATDDADRSNNRMTRTFEFAQREPPLGQVEPSDVSINWVSRDDFRELQARKSRTEQAALQAAVDPVPNAPTPDDPTPPAPRPSQKPSKPSPAVATVAPQQQVPPSPLDPVKPATASPVSPVPPVDPSDAETSPPPMKQPTPDTVAAAPIEGDPVEPSKIDPTPAPGKAPQPITDTTPSTTPTPAPPQTGLPDRTVALLTPPIKPTPGSENPLPEPTATPAKPDDKAMRRAPDAPINPDADPTDKSSAVESDQPGRTVAALPLPPRPDDKPASPATDQPKKPDPEMKRSDKPVDPEKPKTDQTPPKAPPQPQQNPQTPQKPSPARPEASDAPARPTSAPKDTREAPPVKRIENLEVVPGRVVARNGLKINTTRPDFSIPALRLSAPANPIVFVTFDKAGKVVLARVQRTSGYANIDGPILAALYKWTAQGPLLEHVADTWDVEFKIILSEAAD